MHDPHISRTHSHQPWVKRGSASLSVPDYGGKLFGVPDIGLCDAQEKANGAR